MKKYFIYILLLLPLSLFAQESELFGVKLGPSIINQQSSIAGQNVNYSYNWRIAYHAGFTYQYNMANGFTSFMVDVMYAQKGTKRGQLTQNGNFDIKLHYIDVPLLFAYSPSESFHAFAGVEFGLLVKSQISFAGRNINNLDSQYRNFELSPVIGMSYTMPSNVFFDARYVFGVVDIDVPVAADGTQQGVNSVKTINQAFHFSIGYYFSRRDF